ncbi:hypothetical protein LBMAG30_29490 [Comamonadaceae bacterium]|nr:hypothetical protein LBMAG30_29490 [Comamonadaceae bacterium]
MRAIAYQPLHFVINTCSSVALCRRSVVFTNRTTLKITPLDIIIGCDVALNDCDALMPYLMTLTLAARLMQIEYQNFLSDSEIE